MNEINFDSGNCRLYTYDQVEEVANAAARNAIYSVLNLDNETGKTVAGISKGDADMPRQRIHVMLPSGEKVWITGATFSDLIQNALEKYGSPAPAAQSAQSFKQYTDDIYDVFLKPRWKTTTEETNRFLLDKHILPFFGTMPLCSITTVTVQDFFQKKKHLSKSYTKQMLIIMHEIFENAVEDGKLEKDPTASKRITLPEKATKREALTAAQFGDVVAHINDLQPDDALLIALLCFTGMRRGEILGLKWDSVTDKTIKVKSEVTYKSNQPVFHEYTKSKSGIREIHIQKELKPYLKKRGKGFVIGGGSTPITQSKFDRAWQRIGKKINLYGATPHVFRHTYLSMLAASGVDPKTVQTIAGHADFSFTYNRYIHKNSENVANASEKFSETLNGLTQNMTGEIASEPNKINGSSDSTNKEIDTTS